jgi:eukaryotic-like serine/threonine-protein kinase
MALSMGSVINNRYQIEKVLARGGMGAIYIATDTSLNVTMAVKENLFITDESTRQFRREATILANMRHPNLPRVTDHFVIPGQGQYLVMDFIEGEDLKQIIDQRSALPEEEIAWIGASICDALTYLHTRQPQIIHRDIKPGNIKITPTRQIFLVDFGIAKVASPDQGTATGAQSLTPGFSPPEQYGQGTDTRADIYALGATLYNALTGFIPENGINRLMGYGNLIPVREHNPQVSQCIASAIEKALEVQKENRHQTAEAFKQALLAGFPNLQKEMGFTIKPLPLQEESTMAAIPQQTVPPQTTAVPPVEKKRKGGLPWIPIVIGMGLVLICIVAGVFYIITQKPFATATASVTPPQVAEESESTETQFPPTATFTPSIEATQETEISVVITETPGVDVTETPNATPQGGGSGMIAFSSDRSGIPQVYIMNIDGTGLRQVTNELSGACQPSWSPDGDRLVFVSPCSKSNNPNPLTEAYPGAGLFLINADGTNRTILATVPGGDFDPAWSPDGSKIVFVTIRDNLTATDTNIYLYNLTDNSTSALTRDLSRDRHPHWSPDGSMIVFQREQNEMQVWTMMADGSNPSHFSDINGDFAYMPDWSPNQIIAFAQGESQPEITVKQYGVNMAPEVKISTETAWNPRFSPDGTWILYEGLATGTDGSRDYEIFITFWNGGVATNISQSPGRDYQPVWHP